jgi:hypothetical protein
MSKARLEIDMPDNCIDCKFCGYKGDDDPCCLVTNKSFNDHCDETTDWDLVRAEWCPLREVDDE